MANKKLIASLIAIAAIILVGTIIWLVINRFSTQAPPMETVDADVASVRINNLSSFTDIDIDARATIEDSLNQHISELFPDTTSTGIVREGSYVKTIHEAGATSTFLVDFADLKLTYKITVGQDSTTGEHSVYVICPSENELIYAPFNCKDDLSGSIR
jgi:hypothetical protein